MNSQERVDQAAAKLLIELAFAIPVGAQEKFNRVSLALSEYKDALIARERNHESTQV